MASGLNELGQALRGEVVACEGGDRRAVCEHHDSVADRDKLLVIRGRNEYGASFGGGVAYRAVDLLAGNDVDTLGRLVEQEETRGASKPAR